MKYYFLKYCFTCILSLTFTSCFANSPAATEINYDFTKGVTRGGINYILDTNYKVAKVNKYKEGEKNNPYQYAYTGDIVIPATITYEQETYNVIAIRYSAFTHCTGLNSVIIPESVNRIEEYAFNGCSNLTSIILPYSLTSIGENAFLDCYSLTNITIPKSMTTISSGAFSGCGLTSVSIPDNVIKIDKYAFYGCPNLASVTIPESVTNIGENAFASCSKLKTIIIPNSVTTLGGSSFSHDSSLESVIIGDGVVSIEGSAFSGCSSLTDLVVGSSVTSIEGAAFSGCNALTAVTLKSNALVSFSRRYYGHMDSFFGKQVKNYIIGPEVYHIGDYAFEGGCTGLTSVSIPESVTSIGDYAFQYCYELKQVYCHAKELPITGNGIFNGVQISNATLHVPDEAIDKYKATEPWKFFGKILPLTSTYIPGVETGNEKNRTYYNLNGCPQASPQHGINIVRMGDGTTKKVVVK